MQNVDQKSYYYNFIEIITIIITIIISFWKDDLEIFGAFPGKPKELSMI